MARFTGRGLCGRVRAVLAAGVLLAGVGWEFVGLPLRADDGQDDAIANNRPFANAGGHAATFSSEGHVDLTGEYFQAQGTNGRSCASCHFAEDGWGITPQTLQRLFVETEGTHPVFNPLDANNPTAPVGPTLEDRATAYSMLLTRGVFRRGGPPRADREWDLVAADDPHGFANLNRLVHWRRSMPTINFAVGSATVHWDGGVSVGDDQHAGLANQAARSVVGGLQGPPAPPEVIADIVGFEMSLWSAQLLVPGVGRLDAGGARGGPEAMSRMDKAEGRFDLFDAWGDDGNPRRAQIARGQSVFNGVNAGGLSCAACHNSANNGTNVDDRLFDIGTASAAARTPDLPLYTFRNRSTGETRELTDAGQGNVTGRWNHLGRFKTPSLRALAARPPYFHNGIAETLEDVVLHYEEHLRFVFTDDEREDLVSFLNAL